MTMKLRLIDYEPLADNLNPTDEEGFQSYFEGLPTLYAKDRFEVVEWCCERLHAATEDWDSDLGVTVVTWTTKDFYPEKKEWDKTLDNLIEHLVVSVGEHTARFAFNYCPYCGKKIEFEDVGRIVKRPEAEPLEPHIIYRWYGPDETPWWGKKKEEGEE